MISVLQVKYIRDFLFAINLEKINSYLIPYSQRKHLDLVGIYRIANFKITCKQVLYFESIILLDCYYKTTFLRNTTYACDTFVCALYLRSGLHVLQWFYNIIKVRNSHFTDNNLIGCICFGSSCKLEIVQWLYCHGFSKFTSDTLRDCIFYGHIDVYFWLYQKLTVPLTNDSIINICRDACMYSRLQILKSLLPDLERLRDTTDNFTREYETLFIIAVENGFYGATKWLYTTFGIVVDSIDNLIYFNASYSYIHTKTCKWLIENGIVSPQFDIRKVTWYNNHKP